MTFKILNLSPLCPLIKEPSTLLFGVIIVNHPDCQIPNPSPPYLDQVIASAGSDGKIVLNHAYKGTNLLSLDDENSRVIIFQIIFCITIFQTKAAQVNSAWFTSNSQLLASGGNDCLLKVWDLKKRSLISSHKYHFGSITSVHWNLDDSLIASSSLTGLF